MTELEEKAPGTTNREPVPPPAEEPPPQKRSVVKFVIGGAILLVLAVGGFLYWQSSQKWESTDDAQIDGHINAISARVGGTVTKISVEDNQFVKAGTVLVEMDAEDYNVAVDQARAALAQAEAEAAASRSNVPVISNAASTQLSGAEASVQEVNANVATAQRQVEAMRAKIPTVEATVRQAKANADRAARDLDRFQALVAKEEISRQQFDAAKAAADATKAQADTAEAQLQEVHHAVEVAQQQVAQEQSRLPRAQAEVRSAGTGPQQVAAQQARVRSDEAKIMTERAKVEQAELNLGHTVIRAPVDGMVRRNVEIGQIVQPGQMIVALVPMDDLWVSANFKESQLAKIRPGQAATIAVDAYGGKTFNGHVDSISPATGARFSLLPPENATGNYVKVVQRLEVKIVLDKGQDPDHTLRPGMSVVPTVSVK